MKLVCLVSDLVDANGVIFRRKFVVTHVNRQHDFNRNNESSSRTVGCIFETRPVPQTLNLKSNQITAEGARAIAESKSFPKLQQLILKFNRIGEDGAKHLAVSENLGQLTTLDLFRNHIGDEGKQAIKTSRNFKFVNRIRLD